HRALHSFPTRRSSDLFVPKIEANAALTTFVTDPRGTQGWIRPNHKHPPFNNKKARQALLYIVDQPKYLKAAIGVEKYYKPCPALDRKSTRLNSSHQII